MSNEYLVERDNRSIAKSRALLADLPDYVKQFYDAKKGSKQELTRYAYLMDIRDFLGYLSPIHKVPVKEFPFELLGELTVQDIDEYRNVLFKSYAPSSVKRKLASVSSFYKYLVLAGFVKNNPAAIIDWPKENKSKTIVYLDDEQTSKLLNGIYANNKQLFYLTEDSGFNQSTVKNKGAVKGAAKNKNLDYVVRDIDETTRKRREKVRLRNFIITALFLKTGVRVSELVSIDLGDIDFRNTIIMVTGKGGKTRPVGFGEEILVNSLKDYLGAERKALTKNNPTEQALFVSSQSKRMSVRQVETMIKEMVQTYLADDPVINAPDISPHKLRSTCASRLLRETGNIKAVSDLLGHESIQVTSDHYAKIQAMQNAQDLQAYEVLKVTGDNSYE